MPRGVYVRTKRSSRLSKTYEEIYGEEKAKELKEKNRFAHLRENLSPAIREKQRVSHLRENLSPAIREKQRVSHLRENLSPATRKNYSLGQLGKHVGEKNCMFGKCGEKHPNFGKHPSLTTRKKQSLAKLGPNCHLYRDGKSNEPYGVEFTSALKLKIRKRDDFMCQFPGCGKLENGKAHHVHHIDHNKHNNNEFNLILLDNSCHEKEKFIDLDEAIIMFEDILRVRDILR